MAFHGWPSLCIRVQDLETSKRFYQKIGMELISEVSQKRAILGFGGFRLALMTFLDETVLNIRGGNAFDTFEALKAEFPELEGEPERYTAEQYDADSDGAAWSTRDPDGNSILFDTHALEVGPEYVQKRTLEILEGAAQELAAMGADSKIIKRLRDEVINPAIRAS